MVTCSPSGDFTDVGPSSLVFQNIISSSESKSALSRLRRAEDERHDLIGQLRKSRDEKKEVENEMETIKRSYEEQLNTMTEELAQQLANGSVHNSTGSAVEEEVKSNKKSRFSLFSRNSS